MVASRISRRSLLAGAAGLAFANWPRGAIAKAARGRAIGGLAIGTAGGAGSIYEGFILSGGDDFDAPLGIVSSAAPHAPYFDTRAYLLVAPHQTPRAAGSGELTLKGYDVGPTHSGFADANRGQPVSSWSDMIGVSGSALHLKSRAASEQEKRLSGGKDILSSMIHSGGHMVARPPCIIEARVRFDAGAVMNKAWHPTFWLQLMGAMNSWENIEIDWESMDSVPQTISPNSFLWTGGKSGRLGSHNEPVAGGLIDGQWHEIGFILLEDRFHYLLDGQIVKTKEFDLRSKGDRAAYLMLTNHVADFNKQYELAAWRAAGSTGAQLACDWWRMWRKAGSRHRTPSQRPKDVCVDFGKSASIALPSARDLWGSGDLAETIEAIVHDELAPGGNDHGGWTGFPPFVQREANRLIIHPSDKPGRLHIVRVGAAAGDTCEPQRIIVNIGPRVAEGPLRFPADGTRAIDLYPLCDVGDLLPKRIELSGLPEGLTFDPGSFHLADRRKAPAPATIQIIVTNAVGQKCTVTRELTT